MQSRSFLLGRAMQMRDSMIEDNTVERFSQIEWQNMALISFRTDRRDKVEDFVMHIVGLYSEVGTKFELRFDDATYMRLEVDFAFKRCAADAIDGARCRSESPWKTSLSESNPHDSFSSYLHFEIGLVPKGGIINILARGFTFQRVAQPFGS
jgi:hypothetical protein